MDNSYNTDDFIEIEFFEDDLEEEKKEEGLEEEFEQMIYNSAAQEKQSLTAKAEEHLVKKTEEANKEAQKKESEFHAGLERILQGLKEIKLGIQDLAREVLSIKSLASFA